MAFSVPIGLLSARSFQASQYFPHIRLEMYRYHTLFANSCVSTRPDPNIWIVQKVYELSAIKFTLFAQYAIFRKLSGFQSTKSKSFDLLTEDGERMNRPVKVGPIML